MKLKLFLLLFLIMALQVQAQQPFFQERFYKMDAEGKTLWASMLLPQNRVLLSGGTDGPCGWCGKNNFMLINSNLDTIWVRKGIETARGEQDLSLTKDGNGYVFAGTITNPNVPAAFRYDMLLQKFDLNGQLLWSKSYDARGEYATSVVALKNGGYMFGGYGLDPIQDKSWAIVCTDAQGNLVSRRNYEWGSFDFFANMELTHNGNIIASGNIGVASNPKSRLKLMLLNQNGDSLKGNLLMVTDTSHYEVTRPSSNAVLSLTDGGFLVTGYIDTVQFVKLGMIVKVDSNLNLVWKYIYRSNPVIWKEYTRVKELADGTIIALAYQKDPHISNQFWIEHFSAGGQLLNSYSFVSNITNKLDAITLEALPDSSFIIGGGCYNAVPVGGQITTHYGLYVTKVKIPGLAKAVTGMKPEVAMETVFMGQSYPNPTASTAIIPYNLPVSSRQALIIIRDITGREVGNYALRKNSSSLEVNLSNLQHGIYTYTLIADGKPVATKKLAVMR
jgi:hypothetical protein